MTNDQTCPEMAPTTTPSVPVVGPRALRSPVRRTGVALLAAALAVAACGGGGDEDALDTGRAGATSSTIADTTTDAGGDADGGVATVPDTVGDDAATSGTAPPPPGSDAGGQNSQSTTTPPAPTQTTVPGDHPDPAPSPSKPIVPRAGTYTYQRTTTTNGSSETDSTDSVVERLSGDDHAGRVRLTIDSEQGTIANEATVDDSGVLVERSVIQSPLGDIDCDWQPDWLLSGPYVQGTTWTFASACSDNSNGLEVDVTIEGSGVIAGVEEIEVNGSTILAWIVDSTTESEFTITSPTLNGSQKTTSTSRTWIDPATGNRARDVTTNDSAGDFMNGTSETRTELTAFRPA